VETEAYVGPHDDASHAAARIGRTKRNAAMFGAPGTAYVYRIYGVHWCLNVVTDEPDYPAAVLIRALEPVSGLEHMHARRAARDAAGAAALSDRALASGPGKLAQALGVTGALDGHDLTRPPLAIHAGSVVSEAGISSGPRIGITRAAELPLRFWLTGNPHVSRAPGRSG
jgi:DNA-3-methyladenine glycosylase